MEFIVTGIVSFLLGGGAAWRIMAMKRRDISIQEPPEEVPDRLKKQYENFFNYDGTERGQRELDGKD